MTKYVLHGGKIGEITENNKKFFREIFSGFQNKVNFLCIYFARDKKSDLDWKNMFEEDKKQISSACPDVKINFILANKKKEVFQKQIKRSKIIFLKGGNTSKLRDYLKEIKNLADLWKGKVIAGTSAGAIVLSKYYYDGDKDTYEKGLGILPIKMIVHWKKQRFGKIDNLKKFGEELKIVTIPEQKYVILDK